MGVLDRLDDLWDAGFEVGRTSVNTVIDLVEAPFTEDEYEGFVGTVAGVTMDRGAETLVNLFGPEGVGGAAIGALPEPVRDVGREALEGLEWAYGYTSRGIATAMTAASLTEAEGQGNNPFAMIDGGLWRQAWHMTEDRSPGQAVALAMLTDDILDEEQVAHYEGTAFYNIMSGTWDAAFRLFLSPEVVAGYGVMLGRAGARRAAFNNYFDDGRGFGAFADDVGRMADDAAAPAGAGRAPEDVAFDDFAEMASRGQLHKATGRDFPGEATAASPYELGRINKYSEDDIAHFYNNRRRGDRLGYDEWVQDRAAYHAKAADDTALHDLAGRIREKYFPTHGDGDLVAYELARSYLGRHGFTGGRASMENVMRFFMGETSAIGKIAEDSGEAAGWFGKLFADTAVVDDVLPPGTPGAEAARFDRAQAIAADINPDDYLLMDPKKFTGFATIDEVVRPGLRSNLVESMERSSWYRPDGDAGRVGRYVGRTIRVFRDMKPQRTAWVGDANSGEQVARVLQEAGYSAAEVTRFRGKWASMTRGQRMSHAESKQREVVKRLVNKHLPDLKKAEVEDLLNDFAKSNMSGRSLLSRVVKYDADKEISTIRIIDPDTGDDIFHHLPLTPGQLEQTVVTLDAKGLDRFLKAAASKHGTDLRKITGLASDGLGLVMSWWRPAMLLRPAWAIRVVGDEQLRMMAKLGALTQLTDLLGPARREYVDAVLRRKIAGLGGDGELTARQLMTRRAALTGGAGFLFAGPIGAGVGAGASLVRNNRNIRRLTARTASINAARAARGTAAEASALASMNDLGVGNLDIMGYDVQAAFGDALAPQIVWRKANSANRQVGYLLLGEERKFWDDIGHELGDWNRVWDPSMKGTPVKEYARWWERVVNDQYGSNQVGRIAFDDSLGSADDRVRALVAWVEDPSNADFAAAIQSRLTAEGADGWAAKVVEAADRMLAHSELRAKIAGGKRVRFDDLQRVAKEEGTDWRNFVGSVHAQEVFRTGESAITQRARRLVDNLYARIGTLTTDNLSRNPYFKRVYETDMKRRIARYHLGDGNYELTATQLRALEQSSRRKALQETRDLLYDLAESSQFSDMMRNVMPFFNAWQEVLTRWAGLTVENPVFAARMAQAFRADIQLGDFMQTVETDDGRFFQFRLPELAAGALKHGILGDAFDDAGVLRFRADSLNMITQGLPGFGPIAQVPASALVKEKPELEEALGFILPYGPVDPLQSLQPAWMKRLTSALAEDRSYESFAAGLMLTRIADMENGDLEPIDFDDGDAVARFIDDVKSDANNFMVLRSVASAFSPASVQFHSPYQLWIDRYRELRAEDFKTADEKFFAELTAEGNEGFFALAARFTQNNEGLPATIESEQVREKYLDLIRRHPEVGGLILGIEGGGSAKFSAAVYEKQLMEDTSPGSGVKRRERLALDEILTNVKVREGWQEYGAMNDVIYNEMRARGLPNLQVSGAKDLQAVRQELIRQLSVEHPLWFDEYRDPDLTKWQDRFEGIRAIVADERLAGRDDIRLLGEYMELRDVFTAELAARKAAGGAQSLTATSNRDLLAVWESMMEEMLENPTFSDLLWRWLEFDPLSRDTWPEAQQETLRLAA